MGIVVFSVYLGWLPAGGFEEIGAGHTGFCRVFDIAQPSRAADADARPDLPRDLPAHHARLDAGGAQPRFRPHRARQGPRRDARGAPPRAAQRAAADGDARSGCRPARCSAARSWSKASSRCPGLGRLAYEAVVQRDLNTLLGIVFVSALLVIAVNFIVDLLYARLDPRIAAEGERWMRVTRYFRQPRRRRRPDPAAGRDRDGALAPASCSRAIRWRWPAARCIGRSPIRASWLGTDNSGPRYRGADFLWRAHFAARSASSRPRSRSRSASCSAPSPAIMAAGSTMC